MPSTEPDHPSVVSQSLIHVAAGIIFHNRHPNQILIAKRPQPLHQGGLWEFPGGKVNPGESTYQALQRELLEELGIEVIEAQPLMQVRHNYTDKQVLLDIWTVTAFKGQGTGMEGQECRWVELKELLSPSSDYQFPGANKPILENLKSHKDYKS